jgi:hypothetical protein
MFHAYFASQETRKANLYVTWNQTAVCNRLYTSRCRAIVRCNTTCMYSLTFLFDSYFGFQDAKLRIMFCTIFFKLSAGIGCFLCKQYLMWFIAVRLILNLMLGAIVTIAPNIRLSISLEITIHIDSLVKLRSTVHVHRHVFCKSSLTKICNLLEMVVQSIMSSD